MKNNRKKNEKSQAEIIDDYRKSQNRISWNGELIRISWNSELMQKSLSIHTGNRAENNERTGWLKPVLSSIIRFYGNQTARLFDFLIRARTEAS